MHIQNYLHDRLQNSGHSQNCTHPTSMQLQNSACANIFLLERQVKPTKDAWTDSYKRKDYSTLLIKSSCKEIATKNPISSKKDELQ
jgi:hypothetical protein